MKSGTVVGGVSWLLLCAAVVPARAIGTRPCEQPRVFEGAAVNAVVLPYRFEGSDQQGRLAELPEIGERLSAMVQLEVLFAMLKYGSVGTTRLSNRPGGTCDPDQIVSSLTRGSSGAVKPGNGLVLIWGRIYVDGDQIYLQSYLRFLRRDVAESIAVDLWPEDRSLQLVGRLPAQAVAMPPRVVTRGDLNEIEQAFRTSLVVRPVRDERIDGAPFEIHPRAPFAASVVDAQGDWMKLESITGGPSGWVRARADSNKWALRRFLPELAYFDAVVGYLRLNSATSPLEKDVPAAYRWVTEAFRDYEEAVGRDAAPLALGLSRALRGFLLWTKPVTAERAAARREASALFAESMKLTPHYAEARNLAAIAEPYGVKGLPPDHPGSEAQRRLGDALLGALAVDAHNATALDNLERLYRFAQMQSPTVPLYPDLPERLELIRAARAKGR